MKAPDLADLRYLPKERVWFAPGNPDFVVGGSEQNPDPVRLELARRVAGELDSVAALVAEWITNDAAPYLGCRKGEWEFVSFDFGRLPESLRNEFEVALTHASDVNDPYAIWIVSVRFDDTSGQWTHVQHHRQPW
jgi:hypothetical protein